MNTTRFAVDGMDCASCATKIETVVRRLPGIEDVSVSVQTGLVMVTHGDDADLAPVSTAVARLGYRIAPAGSVRPSATPDHAVHDHDHDHRHGHGHDHAAPHEGAWWTNGKLMLTAACGLLLAAAFLFARSMPAYG